MTIYEQNFFWIILYIWVEILLHSIFNLSMSQKQQYSRHPVNFSKNKIICSPCSHKIYPLSSNLKQSSALRTFFMGVYSKITLERASLKEAIFPPIISFLFFLPKYSILVAIISQLVKKLA